MNDRSRLTGRVRKRLRIAAAGTLIAVLSGLVSAWFAVTQPLFTGRDGVPSYVDPKRLETHVRALAEDLVPRDWRHPQNLDRAADYIRQEFENAGGRVREQPYEMADTVYRNVIADFGPNTNDRLVVGAHYDALGNFSGADDNASGVAGLIELAHALGAMRLSTQVELVAFTLEEPKTAEGPGLFRSRHGGSAVHVTSLTEQGVDVRLMLSLEMIGFYDDADASQRYPLDALRWFYPLRGDFVAVVGTFGQGAAVRRVKAAMRAASTLPVHSLSAPTFVEGVDWSDHANYWPSGWNAVMITDTAIYRNLNYHRATDTPDTLDYARMAQVVAGVSAVVRAFAGEEPDRSRLQ